MTVPPEWSGADCLNYVVLRGGNRNVCRGRQ